MPNKKIERDKKFLEKFGTNLTNLNKNVNEFASYMQKGSLKHAMDGLFHKMRLIQNSLKTLNINEIYKKAIDNIDFDKTINIILNNIPKNQYSNNSANINYSDLFGKSLLASHELVNKYVSKNNKRTLSLYKSAKFFKGGISYKKFLINYAQQLLESEGGALTDEYKRVMDILKKTLKNDAQIKKIYIIKTLFRRLSSGDVSKTWVTKITNHLNQITLKNPYKNAIMRRLIGGIPKHLYMVYNIVRAARSLFSNNAAKDIKYESTSSDRRKGAGIIVYNYTDDEDNYWDLENMSEKILRNKTINMDILNEGDFLAGRKHEFKDIFDIYLKKAMTSQNYEAMKKKMRNNRLDSFNILAFSTLKSVWLKSTKMKEEDFNKELNKRIKEKYNNDQSYKTKLKVASEMLKERGIDNTKASKILKKVLYPEYKRLRNKLQAGDIEKTYKDSGFDSLIKIGYKESDLLNLKKIIEQSLPKSKTGQTSFKRVKMLLAFAKRWGYSEMDIPRLLLNPKIREKIFGEKQEVNGQKNNRRKVQYKLKSQKEFLNKVNGLENNEEEQIKFLMAEINKNLEKVKQLDIELASIKSSSQVLEKK